MSFDPAVIAACAQCRDSIGAINDEFGQRFVKEIVPGVINQLEPLFTQRQPLLDATEGFWYAAITSPNSPTSEFLVDADHKLCRAVQSVRVTKTATPGQADHNRRLTVTLRNNIFAEAGDIHREMRSDGTTVSCTPIRWKVGAAAMRGTILRVFEQATADAEAWKIIDAFDVVFQNPAIMMNVAD
jgi:hypothetical protein